VIEHIPNNLDKFLYECSRILKPNGFLIITTDFHPSGIQTKGLKPFGMDWIIFDYVKLKHLIRRANRFGFSLISELPKITLNLNCPVLYNNRNFTFIYLSFSLKKSDMPKYRKTAIICPSLATERDGISEYDKTLSKLLNTPLYEKIEELPAYIDSAIMAV
jgi:SAM-dependent methyltransferase